MHVLPSVGWYEEENRFSKRPQFGEIKDSLFNLEWHLIESKIVHSFTHFNLNVSIATTLVENDMVLKKILLKGDYKFVKAKKIKDLALPSIMKKIIRHLQYENIIKI